ncbi:hypothetical protein [Rhizobium laguerreae]|uniref:hypothetical protein n=1 Tax=Rhizobium laguerreae TaxID=1076926 RepID=UPI001C912C48|nr:hypothetical protein [Rhizobium laguerreae]MBY3136110.1 hypothetical protein [Rhizobium laguerreae]
MTKYPSGMDYVWIGSDKDGFLAAFVTGGFGSIPLAALEDAALPLENVEPLLAEMPSVSKANLLVSYPRPDDFIAIAEKGFFVYDWADTHRVERDYTRKYEMVAAPTSPVPLQKLPSLLQVSARRIKFNFPFSEEILINIKDNFQPHEICAPT